MVWRLLRWLGVPRSDLDDVTQEVFWIALRRIDQIQTSSERSFLFGVAIRKAASARRAVGHSGNTVSFDQLDAASEASGPDEQLEEAQARELLHEVLRAMPDELRVVFALFELEEVEIPEIAALLEIPVGTVGSRLRRAREEFSCQARRVRARLAFQERER
jgi:RNA polymerase sigma-70 factor (ECF subfamily)